CPNSIRTRRKEALRPFDGGPGDEALLDGGDLAQLLAALVHEADARAARAPRVLEVEQPVLGPRAAAALAVPGRQLGAHDVADLEGGVPVAEELVDDDLQHDAQAREPDRQPEHELDISIHRADIVPTAPGDVQGL